MNLVDMKLPKKSEKEMKNKCMPATADQPRYPYGLELRFENEQFEKVPALNGLKVGDTVIVQAKATVTATRESDRQGGGKSRSCVLQIEQIGIEQKKRPEQMNMKEYAEYRSGSK